MSNRDGIVRVLAAVVALAAASASAATTVLYDGSTQSSPTAGGYLFYAANAAVTPTSTARQTTLDTTTANSTEAGFSNYFPIINAPLNAAFPTLDRSTGFDVLFNGSIASESSVSVDRAGFALIALSSDAVGIELDFTSTGVFAQDLGFTAAESAPFNTTASTDYDLSILGNSYTLDANGKPILVGGLRSYGSPAVPYTLPNFLFVGDDTSEAASDFSFSYLAVSVPEPTSAFALAVATASLALRPRRPA